MTEAIAHPVICNVPRERLAGSFTLAKIDSLANPLWHFTVAVERTSRISPAPTAPPPADGRLTTLALFNRPSPSCDLEIYGAHLDCEIHPADFLDLWMTQNHLIPVSLKRVPTPGGAIGDAIVSWQAGGTLFLGRCFCLKAGNRLVLLWFRTAATDYAVLADDFFVSMSNFHMLDDSTGMFAEKIHPLAGSQPLPWKLALPESWNAKMDPAGETVASFQAALVAPADPPVLLAKLSFALISSALVQTPQDAFDKTLAAAREGGVVIQGCTFKSIPAAPPFARVWELMETVAIAGNQAEMRCHVLQHPQAWVIALVVGPQFAQSPILWMRCRRVLDLLVDSLELGS